jgi:25S rRNA (uracil2843-N3)-methyltransferase
MGKNGRFGKEYGKVVGKDSASRPGWKGPGYVKKSDSPAKAKAKTQGPENVNPASKSVIPIELQQLLLDIFRNTFSGILAADTLQPLLQEVKAALYERDFSRAFGSQEYLAAYSVRWSPSRSLCYLSILVDLQIHLTEILGTSQLDNGIQENGSPSSCPTTLKSTLTVVCFGGGAAEVVAFGGFLKFLLDTSTTERTDTEASNNLSISDKELGIDLLLVDTAQWGDVVQMLNMGLTTPPPLSNYASSSAKEANSPLISAGRVATTFRCDNVLDLSQNQLDDIAGRGQTLLTLFFTLNELYATSIGKTTALLLSVTTAAKPGTLLLVVDSPGSYSETIVGKDAKKYPIQWLLDHTLLETEKNRGQDGTSNWLKVFSDDSRWFRLPDSLRYLIPLENMRYQISLYRRL